MEADKENVHRLKAISRIPIPVHPLPALPKHVLLSKTSVDEAEAVSFRLPLRTLTQSNTNVPSSSSTQMKKKVKKRKGKTFLKLDSKNVTVRQENESLDWDHNVFKDDVESIISISDDSDENEKRELKYFATNKQKNNCIGGSLAVTPRVQNIEHRGVRNIKKSLKRPHSRELQGLSTVDTQGQKVDDKVKRRLQFNEPLQERLQAPGFWKKSYMKCLSRDYTRDIFEHLLYVERKSLAPRLPNVTRACVINWLMKVNGPDGNPMIIQSACWYLDSILSNGEVQLDKLQLVAAACYWIAQKLHGPSIPAMRLVKCSCYAFTANQLVAAEKAFLLKLKFPPHPVIPQEFIDYLSWWCDEECPGEIEVAATFLCLSGLMVDKTLTEEFPSVIAVAAVTNALLLLGKRELIHRLQLCPVYQAAEKKTSRMSCVTSILRRAVRTMSAPNYEYKTPLQYYGEAPYYIAQRIIKGACELKGGLYGSLPHVAHRRTSNV